MVPVLFDTDDLSGFIIILPAIDLSVVVGVEFDLFQNGGMLEMLPLILLSISVGIESGADYGFIGPEKLPSIDVSIVVSVMFHPVLLSILFEYLHPVHESIEVIIGFNANDLLFRSVEFFLVHFAAVSGVPFNALKDKIF